MGYSFRPPEYPTRVLTIPSKLPNRESGPQNQPNANVAVLVSAGAAASNVGILVLLVDVDDSILLPFLISVAAAESALL